MAKVAVRVFKGTEKCGPTDIPNMIQDHFPDAKAMQIDFSVMEVDGGEIAIATDLPSEYGFKLEETIMSFAPADGMVERLRFAFPKSTQDEEEYALPGERQAGLKILHALGMLGDESDNCGTDEDFEYSLPVVFELPAKKMAELKWT
ncbi:hypothetical protein [Paenibacillus glufosinatiresistens]|uniref:hypothetical protein n=1 Tax=Paenibacillus glufosinatiresistens TaxID=3070657 RepID=UPI00286E48BD|nr:hypothetical protein [Paenibacillus sp. YX.27]